MIPEETKKKINEAGYDYEEPPHRNCYGCCQNSSDYRKAFVAGANFGYSLAAEESNTENETPTHILLRNQKTRYEEKISKLESALKIAEEALERVANYQTQLDKDTYGIAFFTDESVKALQSIRSMREGKKL